MGVELPEIYNAATTFVDENIIQGRGGRIAIYYQDEAITYQEVYEKVNRGEITDSLTVAAVLKVMLLRKDGLLD